MVQLDPVAPATRRQLAYVSYLARRYDDAIAEAHQVLELHPDFMPAHYTLGLAYTEKGMYDEAVQGFEQAFALVSTQQMRAWLGYGYARAGRTQEARSILQEIEQLQEQRYVLPPRAIGIIYLALGEPDAALSWLERALEERDPGLFLLPADPTWDPLRSDPRFEAFLLQVHPTG
jgi:tetratricopeptide (TPR) repeat protein